MIKTGCLFCKNFIKSDLQDYCIYRNIDKFKTFPVKRWMKCFFPKIETWIKMKKPYCNYMISDFGRIRNKYGNILKSIKCRCGYLRIRLSYKGKVKAYSVNRLIMENFKKKKKNLEVNHKDRNKDNNYLINLEYMTKSENQKHWRRMNKLKFKG